MGFKKLYNVKLWCLVSQYNTITPHNFIDRKKATKEMIKANKRHEMGLNKFSYHLDKLKFDVAHVEI